MDPSDNIISVYHYLNPVRGQFNPVTLTRCGNC